MVLGKPILYTFVLDKPLKDNIICQPETIHFKKKKYDLNTRTLCLEVVDDREVKRYRLLYN